MLEAGHFKSSARSRPLRVIWGGVALALMLAQSGCAPAVERVDPKFAGVWQADPGTSKRFPKAAAEVQAYLLTLGMDGTFTAVLPALVLSADPPEPWASMTFSGSWMISKDGDLRLHATTLNGAAVNNYVTMSIRGDRIRFMVWNENEKEFVLTRK
jgi:hypothetical protein